MYVCVIALSVCVIALTVYVLASAAGCRMSKIGIGLMSGCGGP